MLIIYFSGVTWPQICYHRVVALTLLSFLGCPLNQFVEAALVLLLPMEETVQRTGPTLWLQLLNAIEKAE